MRITHDNATDMEPHTRYGYGTAYAVLQWICMLTCNGFEQSTDMEPLRGSPMNMYVDM